MEEDRNIHFKKILLLIIQKVTIKDYEWTIHIVNNEIKAKIIIIIIIIILKS